MSPRAGEGFPWLWLYWRAIDCGLDAATFWASSPRAIRLVYNQARAAKAAAAPRRRPQSGKQPPQQNLDRPRVRLNYIPHP